ncbi:MAG: 7-cyano-7-deazaguanine synthase QueC [Planctomycetes bacterium]|nr:7-cyano-7-deazaguanine synthase QueC [Planctomycetota bacterium]
MKPIRDTPPDARRAVVLLSGGLDSAVTLAALQAEGCRCATLAIDYGQRHRIELEFARRVSKALGAAEHRQVAVDLRTLGGSALTADIEVPRGRDLGGVDVPVTYVPARNTIFLSVALGFAESIGARQIAFGANALDYSGYPDCRPEFIEAFERLANLATRDGVEAPPAGEPWFTVRAPLLRMTKGEIVSLGRKLGVDFALTTSCYDPGPGAEPCGTCDSCRLRAKGFAEARERDPRVK